MESWTEKIPFFKSKDFETILKFLHNERKQGKSILPARDDIMNAMKYTRFDSVKVVIIGQDPYPNKSQAHGLAFSIPKACKKIPASLRNILKELEDDLGIVKKNGNLSEWSKQGVLLLNTTLTIIEGSSNSHKDIGWDKLTSEIINVINKEKNNVVFILWGSFAQGIGKNIDRKRHLVIESPHPSPFSARLGFFGSKPFSKANEYLKKSGIKEIDWSK